MLNLTKRSITVVQQDGGRITFSPSGTLATVDKLEEKGEDLISVVIYFGEEKESVKLRTVKFKVGKVEGLPKEGTPCLVDKEVAAAVPGRKGVYTPDTGPTAIRDKKGLLEAVTRLIAA